MSCLGRLCGQTPADIGLADPIIVQKNIVIRQGVDSFAISATDFSFDPGTITPITFSDDTSSPLTTSSEVGPVSTSAAISASSSTPSSQPSSGATGSPSVVTPTSTPTSVTSPTNTATPPSNLSKGAIAGIAVGAVLGVTAVAAAGFLLWWRQKNRWALNAGNTDNTEHDLPEKLEPGPMSNSNFGNPVSGAASSDSGTANNRDTIASLPELISIENANRARQQSPSTRPDDLRQLEEEERRISEAIKNAEHLERLRNEQRAVQSRIQEAKGQGSYG